MRESEDRMPPVLVVGTRNVKKRQEILEILHDLGIEGRCHGMIIKEEHGTGGFGYDPLFLIPEYHQTFGELSARVKHALSHRGRALEQLRPIIRKLMVAG